jgi:hypothetical protein
MSTLGWDRSEIELLQAHIHAPDADFQGLAEIPATAHPSEQSATSTKRVLALSEGGDDLTVGEGEPMRFYTPPDTTGGQAVVIRDRARALGYYLFSVEQHADRIVDHDGEGLADVVTEAEVIAATRDMVDWRPYLAMQSTLTDRDRRLRLMDFYEWRTTHGDYAAEVYAADATWRGTGLSDSARTLAEQIARHTDVPLDPRLCYGTTQRALAQFGENHRIEYVEGVALPRHANQAIRHAWLEVDERVVELTWPWHRPDGHGAVYWGVPVDTAQVLDTFDRRDGGSAVLLSEAENADVTAAMRGDDL